LHSFRYSYLLSSHSDRLLEPITESSDAQVGDRGESLRPRGWCFLGNTAVFRLWFTDVLL